jgi:thiol-disulfide isomerase/thioredoxin
MLFFIIVMFFNCKDNKKQLTNNSTESKSQVNLNANPVDSMPLEVYDFAGFKKFLHNKDGKIHVINFWATWCEPCVKELPSFEKLNANYSHNNVEVLLVSLDFPHLYDLKLKPFITENKIKSKVIALDDADMNTWIPLINKNWSGSIPATIIFKNDSSKFFERSFTYEELEKEVIKFLK